MCRVSCINWTKCLPKRLNDGDLLQHVLIQLKISFSWNYNIYADNYWWLGLLKSDVDYTYSVLWDHIRNWINSSNNRSQRIESFRSGVVAIRVASKIIQRGLDTVSLCAE